LHEQRVEAWMPTFDEYRVLPVADRLSRLRRTPDELDKAISDRDDAELGRRPDARSWSAKEILCHLRDVEELFQVRFYTRRGERVTT
jgi:DinB superfamily